MDRHVCPWYVGYLLASPLRRLFQNPERILKPFIEEGMVVLEIGPGMGFFTLPMARGVGSRGRIIAVDLQEKMISSLRRRSIRAGLESRIEPRVCTETSLGITDLRESVDFILAFAVVHEVPDQKRLFNELSASLKQGGKVLLSEPSGHVSQEEFAASLEFAREAGLTVSSTMTIPKSLSAIIVKSIVTQPA